MNFIRKIYPKIKNKLMNTFANDVSESVDSDTKGNSSNVNKITVNTTITQQSAVPKNKQNCKTEQGGINEQFISNEQDSKNEQGSINEQDLENINIQNTEMINTLMDVTSVDFDKPNYTRESNSNNGPMKNLDEDCMKKLQEFEDILSSNLIIPDNTDCNLDDINDIFGDFCEYGDTELLKIETNTSGHISTGIKTKLSGNNIKFNITGDFLKQMNNNCDTVIQLDANIPQNIMNDTTLEFSNFIDLKQINNDITKHEESANTKPAEMLHDKRSDGDTHLETRHNFFNIDYSLKAYDNTTQMTTSNNVCVLNSITEFDEISLPVKTDMDTISISSTDTENSGYNSSDFEFITQSEAEMDGLITNFNYRKNEPDISDPRQGPSNNNNLFDKTYRNNHEIPEGDNYLNLFRGIYDSWLQQIQFYENKCIDTSPMSVQYAGLGYNLQFNQRFDDSSDEEFIDEAKATVRKIISDYSHANRKRRRKH